MRRAKSAASIADMVNHWRTLAALASPQVVRALARRVGSWHIPIDASNARCINARNFIQGIRAVVRRAIIFRFRENYLSALRHDCVTARANNDAKSGRKDQ